MRALLESVSGAMSTASISSVFLSPISAGNAAGEFPPLITTTMAGSISSPRAKPARRRRNSFASQSRRKRLGRRHQRSPPGRGQSSLSRAPSPSQTLRGNGSPDLVVTQLGTAPLILKNEGANQHNWMSIDFKPLTDNKSGIGTKVEIYAGALYQKWEVQGASGYLGQNAPSDSCRTRGPRQTPKSCGCFGPPACRRTK